jgi:hypothetical protein
MPNVVCIGNAQAFWGDRTDAAAEMLAREPDLDYLTLDYLAEVSMSILAVQRERDPRLGYPRDFVDVVRSLAPYWAAGGRCRIIANAGGLNPRGCAEACRAALESAGCRPLKIAVVTGDDVLAQLKARAESSEFRNLDTGTPLTDVLDRLITANSYLGAAPIIEALGQGADIVITGRVADPSLVVAAAAHHFGWKLDDWQRLAGATIAGHLIECGTQVTGGISTDWLDVPDPTHIGFPIVEVSDDGSCVVTKPRGTGGRVTQWTVKEQLLYEIGDPDSYFSPDVTASFLSLKVEDLGADRVRVTGARGRAAPEQFKVSATYRDGFRAAGTLTILGRDAATKAHRAGEIVLQRVRDAGHQLRDAVIETLGAGGCFPGVASASAAAEAREIVLRIAVEAASREAVERFAKELMPLITAGPQGATGYAEGRPQVHFVVRYWPCLIERAAATPRLEFVESAPPVPSPPSAGERVREMGPSEPAPSITKRASSLRPSALNSQPSATLHDLAFARSGDKGTSANIGVIARNSSAFAILRTWLTAERVADFLRPIGAESVERYEMANLEAFNFVVRGILRRNLRTDAQGKALGQLLLELPLEAQGEPSLGRL